MQAQIIGKHEVLVIVPTDISFGNHFSATKTFLVTVTKARKILSGTIASIGTTFP